MAKFRYKEPQLGVFNTKDCEEVLSGFENGCRILGLTRGMFSLIDLIHAVLQKTGKAHVVCVTWSAGIKDVHQVKWMMDTDLIQTFILITDHSYSSRQAQYKLPIEQLFGVENIRTSEIHAKFVLIHNEQYKVCIRTSMNLNANRTCESFELDEDNEIFEFYMNFVRHTCGDMPAGFTEESFKASASLDKFFGTEQKKEKKWWEEL